MDDKINVINTLVKKLNYHTELYNAGNAVIPDSEWDRMYFKLMALEQETKYINPKSPTQRIQYETPGELNMVVHNHPMLSLDKSKDLDDIKAFLGDKPYVGMLKMDGLTCSLHYSGGHLIRAETRGDGTTGEDVTLNVRVANGVPVKIDYDGELVVDGEIICKKSDFEQFAEEFKNPRNFAAGSIRLLNTAESAKRCLTFVLWEVVEGFDEMNSFSDKLTAVANLGFTVVPWIKGNCGEDAAHEIGFYDQEDTLKAAAVAASYPIDGLVYRFDDLEYSESLGSTAHHRNCALAYKFLDELVATNLLDIEWTIGRTGALTPVALFEPIEVNGNTIQRASLHNLKVMREILGEHPYIGQGIYIYLANMIIPQIDSAEILDEEEIRKERYKEIKIIEKCPHCGTPVEILSTNNSAIVHCPNPNCVGQWNHVLENFCSNKGLNIKGLAGKTLQQLVDAGLIQSFADIFKLKERRNEMLKLDRIREGKADKLIDSIERSKVCTLSDFIGALGIPYIGKNVAKKLMANFDSYEDFREKVNMGWDFSSLSEFGPSKAAAILAYDYTDADEVYKYLVIVDEEDEAEADANFDPGVVLPLKDLRICVTGKISPRFKTRENFINYISKLGAKPEPKVFPYIDILICNNQEKETIKLKRAREYGVRILTEEELMKKFDL
jgi:DNA ligase (NAD+)